VILFSVFVWKRLSLLNTDGRDPDETDKLNITEGITEDVINRRHFYLRR
jgi:hypothetical protein